MTDRIRARLLGAVQADHPAVRPLLPPWRRVAGLAPLGAILALAAPLCWGWRQNFSDLSPSLTWGLSGVQALVGLFVVGAAFREAVPGRTLSRAALSAVVGATVVVEMAVTLVTAGALPSVVPPGAWPRFAWECFGMAAVSGAPVLAAVAWLAARALPVRPALTGAIYGLGAGLIADSGVRLFCWVSEPAHVLVAHGGAILALAALGALAAALVDRAKARSRWPPEVA